MLDTFSTPTDIAKEVAMHVRQRRIEQGLTQADLSVRAGLSISTYRRFEQRGQISFNGLLQIAFALNCMEDFKLLFATRTWATIDEMLDAKPTKQRVRHD